MNNRIAVPLNYVPNIIDMHVVEHKYTNVRKNIVIRIGISLKKVIS